MQKTHLGEKDLIEVAVLPGRTLEGVAAVHEGAFRHPRRPAPLNGWQPMWANTFSVGQIQTMLRARAQTQRQKDA